ncbi:hypothetical protein, partial [Janthinobacterium sp.]|uniref:hypothetical protein n=1 Tax=Janthinobacterium sp. TaxID=1871054 RepID=UPI00397796C6
MQRFDIVTITVAKPRNCHGQNSRTLYLFKAAMAGGGRRRFAARPAPAAARRLSTRAEYFVRWMRLRPEAMQGGRPDAMRALRGAANAAARRPEPQTL